MNWTKKVKSGDIRAVARLITLVEHRQPDAIDALKKIYSGCGNSFIIGITGPPGVGKSCLVALLIKKFRERKQSVGVLAIDPTSPFSGGALLGDRARMSVMIGDRDIFIRSMASRGASGGLSTAVNDVADILDVSGKDIILIETVGVGQSEVDIAKIAHTVLLVLMPGYGDMLQALKAGVIEIANILVVNKADKFGADETVAELLAAQNFRNGKIDEKLWSVPIVKTCATTGDGIDDLFLNILKHSQYLKENNLLSKKKRERRTIQFLNILTQKIKEEFMQSLKTDRGLQKWIKKIENLELDPYSAAEQAINMIKEARAKKISRRKRDK